jgi:hypothetical protein
MDLRDSHLEKALQHAPDRDLQPGEAVRGRVIAYAADAAKPEKTGWLSMLIDSLRQWHVTSAQVAGLGSVAVALLVLLMVHEQRPADSEWVVPASSEYVAKADAPKRKAAEAEPATDELAREEMTASTEAPTTPEVVTEGATTHPTEVAQAAPAMADAPLPESAAPLPVEDADADTDALVESRTKSTPEAFTEGVAGESEGAADLQYGLMTQGGKALAEQGIRAGNYRLLKIETPQGGRCDEPGAHVPQADAETGYPIEIVDVCVAPVALVDEVEIYNQVMRAYWQKTSQ